MRFWVFHFSFFIFFEEEAIFQIHNQMPVFNISIKIMRRK